MLHPETENCCNWAKLFQSTILTIHQTW